MSRKGMSKSQFNEVMKRCRDAYQVRYVSPVIHPRVNVITAFTIWTSDDVIEFSITNNPDESFDLCKSVNEYLDRLIALNDLGDMQYSSYKPDESYEYYNLNKNRI